MKVRTRFEGNWITIHFRRCDKSRIHEVVAERSHVNSILSELHLIKVDERELRNYIASLNLHYRGYARRTAGRGSSSPERGIVLPPGTRLSAAARAVLTPRAYRKHVMVTVTEMQAEYIDAIRAGNFRKARWVSIRGHLLILWALFRAIVPAGLRKILAG